MPDTDKADGSLAGDADSSDRGSSSGGGLWNAIRGLFPEEPDTSLRAQLEEAIDEHQGEAARNGDERTGGNDLSPAEVLMLKNLLHFSEHDADDVAIPRGQIVALDSSCSWAELVATFAEHGHSRMPVYRDELDEVIGMMHIKDVFAIIAGDGPPPDDWTVLMRQPLYVPQARGALDVLADMRAKKTHLAIVVDEFSGTDGIITIEDLVEEIVGEIEDEHDDDPVEQLIEVSDGVWDADARAELDDVAEKVGDPKLAEIAEPVDTLGGLAFVLAEGVPQPGTVLDHPSGWKVEVLEGDETHVTRLRLHAPEPDPVEGSDDG
ncbi:CBS domain-containing protein [Erythrobacter arachoides]|uniref:CBS domain-containing protein n=1 Tax=Aurantiacibacter arachoides TaxID=1850444 RepID=A0A844ZZU3_9SPHN|nr:hemolysin family protein [Aurantiacibacter arachoides]MXO93713.1 CBS domain-containing protein [Aurantiacibacter arachoides]GGD47189.1 ion transporter [Aurantiacibacter arachoides]